MEANLFQVFIKLQSDLIIRAIIIRRLNFKTKFKIEIEPKSSIINTGWGRKIYHFLNFYYGNGVAVIRLV